MFFIVAGESARRGCDFIFTVQRYGLFFYLQTFSRFFLHGKAKNLFTPSDGCPLLYIVRYAKRAASMGVGRGSSAPAVRVPAGTAGTRRPSGWQPAGHPRPLLYLFCSLFRCKVLIFSRTTPNSCTPGIYPGQTGARASTAPVAWRRVSRAKWARHRPTQG